MSLPLQRMYMIANTPSHSNSTVPAIALPYLTHSFEVGGPHYSVETANHCAKVVCLGTAHLDGSSLAMEPEIEITVGSTSVCVALPICFFVCLFVFVFVFPLFRKTLSLSRSLALVLLYNRQDDMNCCYLLKHSMNSSTTEEGEGKTSTFHRIHRSRNSRAN